MDYFKPVNFGDSTQQELEGGKVELGSTIWEKIQGAKLRADEQ